MKITDEKREQFIEMISRFARSHGYGAEFKYDSINPEKLTIQFKNPKARVNLNSIVCFDQERSLSEAAAPIMAALLRENERTDFDLYCKADWALTKQLYRDMANSHYGANTRCVPDIKDVIFNDPATIIKWSDGTKTVVKCGEGDIYDPEKGMAMAIAKKALGNQGNYYKEFAKWLDPYYEKEAETEPVVLNLGDCSELANAFARMKENIMEKFGELK